MSEDPQDVIDWAEKRRGKPLSESERRTVTLAVNIRNKIEERRNE